tara:strand:- start:292 stop:798 length:507 start_codon:yes stop_codon:yes gene_type:complete
VPLYPNRISAVVIVVEQLTNILEYSLSIAGEFGFSGSEENLLRNRQLDSLGCSLNLDIRVNSGITWDQEIGSRLLSLRRIRYRCLRSTAAAKRSQFLFETIVLAYETVILLFEALVRFLQPRDSATRRQKSQQTDKSKPANKLPAHHSSSPVVFPRPCRKTLSGIPRQ